MACGSSANDEPIGPSDTGSSGDTIGSATSSTTTLDTPTGDPVETTDGPHEDGLLGMDGWVYEQRFDHLLGFFSAQTDGSSPRMKSRTPGVSSKLRTQNFPGTSVDLNMRTE